MDAPNVVARCAVALLRAVPSAIVAAGIALTLPSLASSAPTKPVPNKAPVADATGKIDTEKLFGAIVKLSAVAIPDARSAATLGRERHGSGVVIGDKGLVL